MDALQGLLSGQLANWGVIAIVAVGAVVLLILMSGRRGGRANGYFCKNCYATFKERHHGSEVPHCPKCKSTNITLNKG